MTGRKLAEPRKTKVYSVRFDADLERFINSVPNKSEFINFLIRKEKERVERVERIKVREMLCRMEEAQK
jgi:hypothetical protein